MAFRLYLVPIVGTGTKDDPRRPKYFAGAPVVGDWSGMDYGFEPVMVVGADLSPSEDNYVVGQGDVTALPFDLAPTLTSGQVTAVHNVLETLNLPAGWVTTSLSWLAIVRTVLGMFSFLQRFGQLYAAQNGVPPPSIFAGGVTLNTTFGSLPLAVRTALLATADSFGIPTTGLTGSTTIRVILKNMADMFQNQQYNFNGTLL